MNAPDLAALVAAANRPLTDPAMNRTIGDGAQRFELYHFALSLCSQKVRTCLAEKGAGYVAHDINLSMPLFGNYDPAYVRLRLAGNPGAPLVGGYTGRSSVETEGFDPAVVPTLVDHRAGAVVTDSARICRHIDAATDGPPLIPDDLRTAIEAEIEIVDRTPHVAVFYGAHPDIDYRPERLKRGMPGVHDRKIAKLEKARELAGDDPPLVAAFDAKIAKEQAAKSHVLSPDRMRASVDEIVAIVAALEDRLPANGFLFGDRFTMADLMWTVSLYRLLWLGMGFCWQGDHRLNPDPRARVAAYATALFDRPAFRAAVIDWPGIARTEYVADYYPG